MLLCSCHCTLPSLCLGRSHAAGWPARTWPIHCCPQRRSAQGLVPPPPSPPLAQVLAYGTCLDGRCVGRSSCGALVNSTFRRGQVAWDNADFPKLQATFSAGTHVVLIRLSCSHGCFGDSTLSSAECNSGGFSDVKVITSELEAAALLPAACCCWPPGCWRRPVRMSGSAPRSARIVAGCTVRACRPTRCLAAAASLSWQRRAAGAQPRLTEEVLGLRRSVQRAASTQPNPATFA
jgi:hypothetical protein